MESENKMKFDLEERTFVFTRNIIIYVNQLQKTMINMEIGKQLFRSAGSVGANYIEANEALSKKDFIMRIKICRKEAKESGYWLKLCDTQNKPTDFKKALMQESLELTKIFGAILTKCSTTKNQ
jgi:four helix bundle protein